jgi:uncharacterized protein (DUF983 family)
MTEKVATKAPFFIRSGVAGKCPRCGQGPLFDGFLQLAPRCTSCGLDYSFADAGDGPAVFVILLAGIVVVGLALWVDIAFEPPIWVYVAVFVPLTVAVCLGMLRPLKSLMIAAQYRYRAEQDRPQE